MEKINVELSAPDRSVKGMGKRLAVCVMALVMMFGAVGISSAEKGDADQLYPVKADGKYGFINDRGETVIKAVYESYGYPGVPGGPVYVEDRTAKKQIYYSVSGEKLFESKLNTSSIIYNGLALYKEQVYRKDGSGITRYGYIDSTGQIAIAPVYHKAFNFAEGLARVNQGKASGYINTKGELVIPYRYSTTFDFSEGMAAVTLSINGKYGYINSSGQMAIAPRFAYAASFSDGAAVVYENGKYGYIDKKGKYILKPQFSMAQPFAEGLAFVERNGVTFYINKKGQKVIQNIKAGGTFSGGLAPASKGQKYGYINTKGKFVIEPYLEWGSSFSGELAEVYFYNSDPTSVPDRGYINRSGKVVVRYKE